MKRITSIDQFNKDKAYKIERLIQIPTINIFEVRSVNSTYVKLVEIGKNHNYKFIKYSDLKYTVIYEVGNLDTAKVLYGKGTYSEENN